MRVIGIDGCRKGWFGIVTGGGGVEALFSPRVADLVASAGEVSAIAIDIPIGRPDRGVRQADRAARLILARQGLALDGPLLPAGRHAGPDDVLDAAIAAWSAGRPPAGTAQSLPARPQEMTPGGRPMAIWA